jgi:hypothetical protein
MRTAWIGAFAMVALAGCGAQPPCGVDDQGDDVPYCAVEFPGEPEPLNYCPLEHWASGDDCNTCGCSESGEVICTSLICDPTGSL